MDLKSITSSLLNGGHYLNNMEQKFELKQDVKLFIDEAVLGSQEAYLETDEVEGKWLSVIHDGEMISLSLKNWELLVELVEKVKKQING